MPFTRISLLAGKSPAYLAALTVGLDRALIEAFDVPDHDRFAAIHQHAPGELIFDRSYAGGPRSDDYVLFHITTGRVRPPETKARFYRRLVEILGDDPGMRPEDVMVIIVDQPMGNWSFASGVTAAAPKSPMPWALL